MTWGMVRSTAHQAATSVEWRARRTLWATRTKSSAVPPGAEGKTETRTMDVIAQIVKDNRKPVRDCFDKAKKELPDLKALEQVTLFNTPATDAGLKQLAGLPGLKRVNLKMTKVTDEGKKELQRALPDLKIE